MNNKKEIVKEDKMFYNAYYGLYANSKGEIFRKMGDVITQIPEIINSATGYKIVEHRGVMLNSARVAFGAFFPEAIKTRGKKQIDHINNDKTDNSINNLRLLSPQENSRNKIKRGGRRVVIHNPMTFEQKIFSTISECARYLKVSDYTVNRNINRNTYLKGYIIKSDTKTCSYRYYIDDEYFAGKGTDLAKHLDIAYIYLIKLFISDIYKDEFIYKGRKISRIPLKQDELVFYTDRTEYHREHYRKQKEAKLHTVQ